MRPTHTQKTTPADGSIYAARTGLLTTDTSQSKNGGSNSNARTTRQTQERFACHFEKSERGCEERAGAMVEHIQIAE